MRTVAVIALGAAALIAAAVAPAQTDPAPTTLAVTITDAQLLVAQKPVPIGLVTFKVANRSRIASDFRIAGKKTPSIAPGKTATLRVTFTKTGLVLYSSTGAGRARQSGVLTFTDPCTKPATSTVTVQMTEAPMKLSRSSVPCGSVTFAVTNVGTIPHSFRIGNAGTPQIQPGQTASITVRLTDKVRVFYRCGEARARRDVRRDRLDHRCLTEAVRAPSAWWRRSSSPSREAPRPARRSDSQSPPTDGKTYTYTSTKQGTAHGGIWKDDRNSILQADGSGRVAFPLFVFNSPRFGDMTYNGQFLIESGNEDRYAGFVFRLRDAGDYYAVRFSASENNVFFARFDAGVRTILKSFDARISSKQWHKMTLSRERCGRDDLPRRSQDRNRERPEVAHRQGRARHESRQRHAIPEPQDHRGLIRAAVGARRCSRVLGLGSGVPDHVTRVS